MTDVGVAEHAGPVLLCVGADPDLAARIAGEAAALLAERSVVVLCTWEPPPMTAGLDAVIDALASPAAHLIPAACHAAERTADAAVAALAAAGIQADRLVRLTDRAAWRAILDVADEIDAGVVAAGARADAARHRGWLGSQARALAHHSRRPLLLLPTEGEPAGEDAPALFAYDGSDDAGHALGAASALLRRRPAVAASAWQTAAHVVGVAMLAIPDEVARLGGDSLDAAARGRAQSHAKAAAAQLGERGWTCAGAALETSHSIGSAIIGAARAHDAAVIVTGTRGRPRIAAVLLGSTAEHVVRHACRPVLLVPPARPPRS